MIGDLFTTRDQEVEIVLQAPGLIDMSRDLSTGTIGSCTQPLNPSFRLTRTLVEAKNQFLKRGTIPPQDTKSTFQSHGMKHRRRQHDHQDDL